ncbi:MAG: hypothetical protein ACMXYE_00475 [Candidatus Woesearchaeota archaeon]
MKIEIDTKNDSKEEIKHVIGLLRTALGDEEVFTNQPETPEKKEYTEPLFADPVEPIKKEPAVKEGLFGLWNDTPKTEKPIAPLEEPEETTENSTNNEEKSNEENKERTFYKEFNDDNKNQRIKFY